MAEAYIVDALRSPTGKRKGSLSFTHPIDVAVAPLKAIVERNKLDPAVLEDVIYGCVSQRGEQDNVIAREAALAAGFPEEVPGFTINRFCASGLTACNMAAHTVMAGQADVVVAGGVGHMKRVPMNINFDMEGSLLQKRYAQLIPQGVSAEMISERYGFTRADLDGFAEESQARAAEAWDKNKFKNAIIPVAAKDEGGKTFTFSKDEHMRPGTTKETLAALKPVFKEDGFIHAGNSSGIVDGAATVLFASKKACQEYGLKPRARVVATQVVGSEPIIMLLGPIPCTHKILAKANLKSADIHLFAVNEAFAPVPLAWARDTGAKLEQTNVNGGAIALGHPLGATGAMLLGTVLDELEARDQKYGLVTLCVGLGMASAVIIERL